MLFTCTLSSRAAVPSQLVRSCFRSCLPSCLLPGPSAFSRLLVSLLVSPSPPRRCAVSVCHSLSPLVFFSSLFLPYCRILCPPSRGWSGLVFLLVFHLSSASLFVSFVCPLARNLLKPGFQLETTEFKFPGGPFKNLPGFGPSSSEEPCFTISIQTTEVRVSLRSGSWFFLHGTVPAQSPALPVLLVVAGIMRL